MVVWGGGGGGGTGGPRGSYDLTSLPFHLPRKLPLVPPFKNSHRNLEWEIKKTPIRCQNQIKKQVNVIWGKASHTDQQQRRKASSDLGSCCHLSFLHHPAGIIPLLIILLPACLWNWAISSERTVSLVASPPLPSSSLLFSSSSLLSWPEVPLPLVIKSLLPFKCSKWWNQYLKNL